jgi:hypothetical protein
MFPLDIRCKLFAYSVKFEANVMNSDLHYSGVIRLPPPGLKSGVIHKLPLSRRDKIWVAIRERPDISCRTGRNQADYRISAHIPCLTARRVHFSLHYPSPA